jgi:tRNA 2-thiouridine synthesizing protein A
VTTLDLTGVPCPLNWVKARMELERMAPGQTLTLRLDPGEPLDSVPRSAREDGHDVAVEGTLVRIVRAETAGPLT